MQEKILTTRTIFDGRIVKLTVHDVELMDGTQTRREVIHHGGAVAIVAVNSIREVLLVEQFRIGAGRVMLEIPAGLLEPDENPPEAIARELREETGFRPQGVQSIGGVHIAAGYNTEYVHLFFTDGFDYAPLQQDADEFVTARRLPLTDALALVENGQITDAKSVAGLLRVARRLGV